MDALEEEGDLVLSGAALAALHDFYVERDEREKRFEDLKIGVETEVSRSPLSMEMFAEDWNASQFWYSDETAILLAKELLQNATAETRVAVVSAPSVFIQLKNLLASGEYGVPQISLFEFDNRFSMFKEYVHYDFRSPLSLPADMKGSFDHIICDPPFLSTDCQTKAALTVRWLTKKSNNTALEESRRIIVCTGERMESLILKLYPNLHTTTFEPRHAQDRLSNDFRCYSNYQGDKWTWR